MGGAPLHKNLLSTPSELKSRNLTPFLHVYLLIKPRQILSAQNREIKSTSEIKYH